MIRSRVLAGIVSTAFCLTLAISAKADNAHSNVDIQLEKLIFAQRHNLADLSDQNINTDYLYTAHFENNNGKHLGFSMAAVHQDPKGKQQDADQMTAPLSTAKVTENPEPTAMVLLGTGLAAAAAFARKVNRRRRE